MNSIKFFFVVIIIPYSIQSMNEKTPLLAGCSELQIIEDYIHIESREEKFNVLDLPPESLAHILSFLLSNDRGLNYIVRHEQCKPEGQLHSSPYCLIMQNIAAAHAEYIFEKYRKNNNYNSEDIYSRLSLKKILMKEIAHFMKTTAYRKKQEECPSSWSDIRLLSDLIPKDTAERDVLNLSLLNEYIKFYSENSQYHLNRLYYLNNGEDVQALQDYNDMRALLFNRFIKRAKNFNHYTRLILGNDPDHFIMFADQSRQEFVCCTILSGGLAGLFTILTTPGFIDPLIGFALIGIGSFGCLVSSTCGLFFYFQKDGKYKLLRLLNASLDDLRFMGPTNAIEQV